jgi:UDP-N-acetylglucosamine 2-epimerase (non-hydrolysing)
LVNSEPQIFLVAGARPNFMKIAPILSQLRGRTSFRPVVIHTGQHYDDGMSQAFFRDLELSPPDVNLKVGSGRQGQQTGQIMREFERVVLKSPPDLVMVVGDVNSTVACSLVAAKLHIPVAHVEAGLRSFDRRMPEEINRVLTDTISTYLFTTCTDANENLLREGISSERIFFVGNVMIDSLLKFREKSTGSSIVERLGLRPRRYGLITLHRPSNVDELGKLRGILSAVETIQRQLPMIFPIHPRSRKMLQHFKLEKEIARISGLRLIDPVGYIDFLRLMDLAQLVFTDSGGIQEETTVLGIPCLTLRENTERPITVREGTNRVVGTNPDRIVQEARAILKLPDRRPRRPKLWDGRAAARIVNVLLKTIHPSRVSQIRRKG